MLGAEPAPNKVLEIKADNYSERHIYCREEGLVLYAPQNNTNNKKEKLKYEIVLHKPCTESLHYAYRFDHIFFCKFALFKLIVFCSLFRTESQEEAEEKFINLKDKLPVFIEIAKEVSKGWPYFFCRTF